MQTNQLKPNTRNKKAKYIGRGGKRGTYSGRGIKGQKARAGRKLRPEIRDLIKKLPKKRGYRFTVFQEKPAVLNLEVINKFFNDNDQVNPQAMADKGLIRNIGGKIPAVKILGKGEITKKVSVSGCLISESAKAKLEKAGAKYSNA